MNGGAFCAPRVSSSNACAAVMILSGSWLWMPASTSRMPLTKNCRSSSLNWMLMSIGMAESSNGGGRMRQPTEQPWARQSSQYALDARAERGDEAGDDGRDGEVDLRKVSDRFPALQEIGIGGRHRSAAGLQLIVGGVRPRPDVENRQFARDVADRLADVADDRDRMPRRDQPRVLRRSVAQDRRAHLIGKRPIVDDDAA